MEEAVEIAKLLESYGYDGLSVDAGTPDEIRTCIGCNQGCIWGYFTSGQVGCAVNPMVGHEAECRIEKAQVKKKVVIIGGDADGNLRRDCGGRCVPFGRTCKVYHRNGSSDRWRRDCRHTDRRI